jgi:2-amino-4-hydroxy-6-hydroxymethyldihydropteridine diphosphokinase
VDRAVERPVAVAIGSNLGDRHAAVSFAVERLASFITGLAVSSSIETEPEGEGLAEQPLYLNAVAVGRTSLDARSLLEALLAIENAHGRERPFPNAPRTLDLDLILLDTLVTDSPELLVPHPRFRERFFVLGPLAEVAPDMVDPVTGLKVWELLRKLLADERR